MVATVRNNDFLVGASWMRRSISVMKSWFLSMHVSHSMRLVKWKFTDGRCRRGQVPPRPDDESSHISHTAQQQFHHFCRLHGKMTFLCVVAFLLGIIVSESKILGSIRGVSSKIIPSTVAAIAIVCQHPLNSFGTPLGEHSGCAYPACTSQLEVLISFIFLEHPESVNSITF